MADSKRNSMSGRIATPKQPSGPGDIGASLSKAIGARIKLTTASPSVTLEGQIYTADPITNLIAINTAPNPSPLASTPGDFHIIPVSRIQSFNIIPLDPRATGPNSETGGSGATFSKALPPISKLDFRALRAREEAAIKKLKEAEANRGKGVSKDAQFLFDGIRRLLPARWHEQSIIVNDNVIIGPPYTLDACSAAKGNEGSLKQVKKVVEALRNRQNKAATPTPAASTGATSTAASSKPGTPPVVVPAVPLKKGG